MTDKITGSKKKLSADWLVQGALARIGDAVDRITGRSWIPSSSLATSELIERLKTLIDAEAREITGKGVVVPHNIKLKIQWDKFSTDADESLTKLENELLIATADHINDRLYYTLAPIKIEVKPDYFIEGVKLFVSFDKYWRDSKEAELNVAFPSITPENLKLTGSPALPEDDICIARIHMAGNQIEKSIVMPSNQRISIGRTAANDLMIDDVSVSKIHASIVANADGQLLVADTGSTNGTFVNDERISYGKAIALKNFDQVRFGVVEVVFEYIPGERTSLTNPTPGLDAGESTVKPGDIQLTSRAQPAIQEKEPKPSSDKTMEIEPQVPQIDINKGEIDAGKDKSE